MTNTVNAAAIALVKEFEGLRLRAYADPASGGDPWTVGYGHTSAAGPPKVTKGTVITAAEAETILADDLARVAGQVRKLVTVPLNDNQFGALVSFTFNLGIGNLRSSTLLRRLNAGDYKAAAAELPRWNHAAGKVMAGLTRRRAAEQELFLTPVDGPVPDTLAPPPGSSTGKAVVAGTGIFAALAAAAFAALSDHPELLVPAGILVALGAGVAAVIFLTRPRD